jgi:hypothetical protein
VLHADSTTQSALSLSCANSLAVNSPPSSSVGCFGSLSASHGSASPRHPRRRGHGSRNRPAVVVERRPLHHSFAGVAADVEVAGCGTELYGDRLEFVGGVEKRWQRGVVQVAMSDFLALMVEHLIRDEGGPFKSCHSDQRARKGARAANTKKNRFHCRVPAKKPPQIIWEGRSA